MAPYCIWSCKKVVSLSESAKIKWRLGQFTVSIAVLGYCCVDSLIVVRNFDKKLDFRGYMDGGYKKSPTEYHFGSTHLWRWLVFNGAMGRGCRFQIPGLRSDVHQLVSRWMKLEMIMGNGDDRKDQGWSTWSRWAIVLCINAIYTCWENICRFCSMFSQFYDMS